ncbi:hypothetical protein OC844_000280 [Tilletia horrida]|nr:hypothetical protein OC844_000280 [Tilletia horrida]
MSSAAAQQPQQLQQQQPASPSAGSSTTDPNSPSPSMLSTSAHSSHTGSTSPAASPAAAAAAAAAAAGGGATAGVPSSLSSTSPSTAANAATAGHQPADAPPASDKIVCKWAGCTRTFENADILYTHLCDDHVGRKSTNNLCLTCHWDDCDTTCAKRDHITSHLRVHIPLKPHLCPICSKSFKRPQDLKKHERIHPPQLGHATFGHPSAMHGGAPIAYAFHPHHQQIGGYPAGPNAAGAYPGMPMGQYPQNTHFFPSGVPPSAANNGNAAYGYPQPGAPQATYSAMYPGQANPAQALYDNGHNTYAGLNTGNRKRNHDQIAAVEELFGQVANKRIAPTYDGAMINRLNDTLASFLEQRENDARAVQQQSQQASTFPVSVSQFVGLGPNQAPTSQAAPISSALHPVAQAHQAQVQAAVAGVTPTAGTDLADFNAWLVQLGTDIARGGAAAAAAASQRNLSQPSLGIHHDQQQGAAHIRSHSHGALDPPSGTFDFVASLTQANLTQIPGVDSSLFANTFTSTSADDSVGSLSVGGHSPAPLSASGSYHGAAAAAASGLNDSPFSFDALNPQPQQQQQQHRPIAQLPQRAVSHASAESPLGGTGSISSGGSPGHSFNTSFNSLAQPRNVAVSAARSSSTAATIPQLAPHFNTSLYGAGVGGIMGASMGAEGGNHFFPPTAYRRVEPLMRAAPQPGEALYESQPSSASALRSGNKHSSSSAAAAADDDDRSSTSGSSSTSSSRGRSEARERERSRSRSRSGTPTASGSTSSPLIGGMSTTLPPLYPRILSPSEMAKRTLPPPTASSFSGSTGGVGAKLPSIRAILADRHSDEDDEEAAAEEAERRRLGSRLGASLLDSSRSVRTSSGPSASASSAAAVAADAQTRAAHLQLIIQLLKALNQPMRSTSSSSTSSSDDGESVATQSMHGGDHDDDDDDDVDDDMPLAQQQHRQRTAEEESAAKVLGGLRLARPSDAGMDLDEDDRARLAAAVASSAHNSSSSAARDGQRTPRRAGSPSASPERVSVAAASVKASAHAPAPAPPRRLPGLKDLLNDVGVQPFSSRRRVTAAEGMDLD